MFSVFIFKIFYPPPPTFLATPVPGAGSPTVASQTQDVCEQECQRAAVPGRTRSGPRTPPEPGEQAQPLLVEPRPGDPDRRPPICGGPVPLCSSLLGAEEAGLSLRDPLGEGEGAVTGQV